VEPSARLVGVVSACVGIFLATVYGLLAAPTTYLLDSSELVATTASMGISHPPGHPAYHLLASALGALPFGNYAYRIHLFSGVCSAIACALIPTAAWRAGAIRSRTGLATAALIAVGAGLCWTILFQSVRAEVYALHLLCVATASTLLARSAPSLDARTTAIVAIVLGVGLLNHHYLTLFTFIPTLAAVFILSPTRRAAMINTAWGCFFGASTLLGYVYLYLRALRQPAISWPWPDTGDGLIWTVTAQAFQKTTERATNVGLIEGIERVTFMLADHLSPLGLALGIASLIAIVVARRGVGVILALAILLNLVTQLLLDFDPQNPDVAGYFMSSVWWLSLASAVGLASAADLMPRLRVLGPVVASTLVALVLVAPPYQRFPPPTTLWDSEVLRDIPTATIAPDALWLTAYFETGFNTWYGRAVEDRRPDMLHIHRPWRTYPGFDAMTRAITPDASDLLSVDGRQGALSVDALDRFAQERPVLIEAETMVSREEVERSVPESHYLRYGADAAPPDPAALDATLRQIAERLHPSAEVQSQRNLLWAYFQMATAMCESDRPLACVVYAEAAEAIAPDDPDVAALVRRARSTQSAPP